MKRLLRKLFPKKPVYEPAGIVHYGEFHLTIRGTHYAAYNQPDGRTVVWAGQEPIGDYTSEQAALYAILDHAKENHDR